MSIGGATGDGTLPSADQARELARTLFDLFLAVGNRYQDLRPFGRYLQFFLQCNIAQQTFFGYLTERRWVEK